MISCTAARLACSPDWMDGRATLTMKKSGRAMNVPASTTSSGPQPGVPAGAGETGPGRPAGRCWVAVAVVIGMSPLRFVGSACRGLGGNLVEEAVDRGDPAVLAGDRD